MQLLELAAALVVILLAAGLFTNGIDDADSRKRRWRAGACITGTDA